MSDKKTLKILKEALNLELWSITLYEDIVSRVREKNIRETITGIIDDSELNHMATLREAIHKRISKMPVKEKLNKKRLKEVLTKGLKEERVTQKFYKKCINQMSDKELRGKLRCMLNDEIDHEKKIKKLISSL